MNPHARQLREKARADRERAAEVAVAMRTVSLSIEHELARYWALKHERMALLARAQDSEELALELATSERRMAG